MKRKTLVQYMVGALAAACLYLGTVAVWASLSVGDLLQDGMPDDGRLALTDQQTEILLRIEDPAFFDHPGLDLSQGQGLTTITSSLARQIFLSGKDLDGARGALQSVFRAVFACCKRIDFGRDVMSLVLNRHVAKEEQLRLFVSGVYLGHHDRTAVTGFAAAARVYFDKTLSEISREEFVTLVAMIKAPNVYHPTKGATQLASRVARINGILAGTCKPSGWFDTDYEDCGS